YADEHKLSITERLTLFLEVASAVQHSHQHLVVHRDIKPRKIIVTADGTPRLLDFGIAKIITPDTGVAETRSARGWMTPEYSSPEQLRGESITTASDVYSLGVVLYELLAGRSPYRFENRSPAEVAELISGADPERPSTAAVRIDRATARDDAPTEILPEMISESREGTPEKLRRRLSGDLDNIVLMAMHKDKDLRYASVTALADDIRRHLEGRTVMARKATFSYRASKFIRRNKIAVAAVAIIALTLIASSIVTAWQARVARRAQAQAERRFNEVRRLAHAVVFDYHDAISDLAGSTAVRERLVRDALSYLSSLAEDARGDPSLQAEIANAYEKISSVQGGRGLANLGDTAGAVESLRKCLQIRQSLLAANPVDSDTRLSAAKAFRNLAELLGQRGDREGAEESYRDAIGISEQLLSIDRSNVEFIYQAAISYGSLGDFLIAAGDWKGALENEQKALALFKSIPPDNPQIEKIPRSIAINHLLSGLALKGLDDLAGAQENYARAIAIFAELSRKDPTNADFRRMLAVSYSYQGDALKAGGRMTDALASFRRYAEIAEEISAADPKDVSALLDRAIAYGGIGEIRLKTGQSSEALSYIRRSLDIRQRVYDSDPDDLDKLIILIEGMGWMSKALAQTGNIPSALDESRKTMELLTKADENSERADLRGVCALTRRNIAEAFEVAARSSDGQR
ncbi:MAG TPA: protein kinase, partial [Blastocatellia bacterium]